MHGADYLSAYTIKRTRTLLGRLTRCVNRPLAAPTSRRASSIAGRSYASKVLARGPISARVGWVTGES